VLGYSKLEHGDIAVKEGPFSLRRLLDEVVASLSWHASQHGNQVAIEIDGTLQDGYLGDEDKIKTIVVNFVGNALKYAPGTAVKIRAEEQPLGDGRADVHIEVRDHGPGISAEEQELVFKKYVRGSNAKQQHVAGAGLGLATCRLLAESMEGHVGVESERGEGATFYVCVPLRRAAVPDEIAPPQTGDAAGAAALIVEDQQYNQVVLSGIALELGYAPEVAGTVAEAVALVRRREFAVVLVDWELPDGDGAEVSLAAREREGGTETVIVATTAYDSDDIRMRCRRAGMDDFVLKPYDAVQVRDCIARVRARRAGSPAPWPVEPAAPVRGLNLQAFQSYGRRFPADADRAANIYVEALDEEFAALSRAFEGDDRRKVAAAAHRLHALGGLIGAGDLVEAARQLTSLARQDAGWPALHEKLASLAAAVNAVKQELAGVTVERFDGRA
jgi:CheY-like chemotaxis protein